MYIYISLSLLMGTEDLQFSDISGFMARRIQKAYICRAPYTKPPLEIPEWPEDARASADNYMASASWNAEFAVAVLRTKAHPSELSSTCIWGIPVLPRPPKFLQSSWPQTVRPPDIPQHGSKTPMLGATPNQKQPRTSN